MEKALETLIKNTPFALVVIGIALFLIGAAGGSERLGLRVAEPAWRLALLGMGTVVAGFGALLVWRGRGDVEPSVLAREYGLKIKAPISGSDVGERIQVVGTYKERPPERSVVLIEQSARSGTYWFMKRPVFDDNSKQWLADCRVGGESGAQRYVHVAVIGRSAQAFWDYYFRAGEGTNHWPGIQTLPPDVILCDNIKVRRR
jgi:hypothetical protein